MKIGIKGSFDATLFGPNGEFKQNESDHNTVVNNGFDGIIQRGFSTQTGSAAFNYVAIGSGVTAASAADTALGSEAARAQGTYAYTDATKAFTLSYTFPAGTATGSISEYGVLNAAATGQLFNRATFAVINKGAADTLQVVFTGSLS